MLLAQNDAAIEQMRLRRGAVAPVNTAGVTADGSVIAPEASVSEDDSFGAQQILKTQEKVRSFVVTGSASFTYTNNVALARRDERSDVFGVVDAGLSWSHPITRELEAGLAGRASIFTYNRTPALNFENLNFSAGLTWIPRALGGWGLSARYDLTELLNRDSEQILREHALSLSLQKSFALGRSHGFSLGLNTTLAVAEPSNAERQQVSAFISYHLQITRSLSSDWLFRPTFQLYTSVDRKDFNQILSWTLRYRLTSWAEATASLNYGANRSDHAVFDYDVFTNGLGLGLQIRF